MLKEKCIGSFKEAIEAQKLGADRVELCDNLEEGGTTPSYGTIKMTVEKLDIPAFVIIRPRGGDFYYSPEEIEIMKEDIKICKSLGVNGVVLGVLNRDNTINYEVTKELVTLAKPMEVTFHKAIDELRNPEEEVEKLASIGVDRILSSGTKPTALEGAEILNKMLEKANGKIKIVVAGKVTKENLKEVSTKIPSTEFHGKKIV
ncbi:Copper homeostasis protein CutC [Fusobacterium sp. DD29]|uniref:copper homeostasis protein CutC n=1 Tax=unclassified Fusobacterium TaxID=2648384 RepID=UPI001B8B934C|nr:Copper homeostasis protein CutC [Fusobacterium sp. DD45]MBR8710621.1 Copper homeostasis protein CutC [Fusobacterium sp. DD28]MBR8748637.1 Copper homeostasis protein CutC [Fusobacterium sp. DD29]MBR8751190.1 Copper homeostasis protein CutC [Fusobacterium sp. DD26]MBR8760899.1 Copper homeostasis protein CutC [Fusobacterium sp. DD25]MBR8766911.1 Copper homeostasis protein CutC [Fusobacterium sp. DD43]MBR8770917.1 Copper homeostasis protein CutC [Fusobacterium sp. DD40]MBR8775192.1 Copper hom